MSLASITGAAAHDRGDRGFVYTATNAAAGNAVVVYARDEDGALTQIDQVATGGLGTGAGLGNQGGVVLSENGRWLLVVNAGSNDISLFRVLPHGLRLADRVPSGGTQPISLAIHDRWVYVLNAGSSSINGFRLRASGRLVALDGSTQALVGAGPAQISFSPSGEHLAVTMKATNQIVTFSVDDDGIAGPAQAQGSAGQTPFGFAFDPRGRLIVSEAFGGAAGQGALSSYALKRDGSVVAISAVVADTQTAPCWVVVTESGRYAYTTNAGSDSISSYRIDRDGSLMLLAAVAGQTGAGPIDLALSDDSDFLYALNSRDGSISAFKVGGHGALIAIPGASGLPSGTNGLAAR
jgi:6-phosphogluconolactonase (cycloisomerase 2 family)